MHELFTDRKFKGLVFVVLVLACVGIAAYAHLALKQAKYMGGGVRTISVQGTSETFVRPDLATFTFSVMAEEKNAKAAQEKSATAMNAIQTYLKEQGVEERDIKTVSYNLSPEYEYVNAVCNEWGVCPPGKQNLVGYTAEQSILVKVRAIENAGELIAGVGDKGATNVSGLAFTVEDTDLAKEQVRAEAIAEAEAKAERLAASLGVRLGRLVSYYEESPYPMYGGYGGEGMMAKDTVAQAVAPSVTPGENEITSTINLVYEIR